MHSDFETTLLTIRSANYEPLVVNGIEERNETYNFLARYHYIYAQVSKTQTIRYRFGLDRNGNDYLMDIAVLDKPFEQIIYDVWRAVKRSGQCSMTIFAD